jgi:hypothetical protein
LLDCIKQSRSMTCFKYRILYGCILFWNSIVEVLLCFLTKKLQPFIRTTFFIIGTYFPSFWCWIIVRECSCDRVFDVSSYCFTQIYPFVLFFLTNIEGHVTTWVWRLHNESSHGGRSPSWMDRLWRWEYDDEYDKDKISVCVAALLLILDPSSFCLIN